MSTDAGPRTVTAMEPSLWVFDLAELRFAWGAERTSVTVRDSRGELLATAAVAPGATVREAAFIATDAALRTARVVRDVDGTLQSFPVAFYNPLTAHVGVGAVPDTQVYVGDPVPLPAGGAPATVDGDDLLLAGGVFVHSLPSMTLAAAAAAAHPVPRR